MAWALAGTPSTGGGGSGVWDHSGDVAQVDFTNLAGYSEVMVVFDSTTSSGSGQRQITVSIDNGSNFLTASGDYKSIAGDGQSSDNTSIQGHTTASTAARSCVVLFRLWNLTQKKVVSRVTRVDVDLVLIPTANALNALRCSSGSGNLTGGSIRVYAR